VATAVVNRPGSQSQKQLTDLAGFRSSWQRGTTLLRQVKLRPPNTQQTNTNTQTNTQPTNTRRKQEDTAELLARLRQTKSHPRNTRRQQREEVKQLNQQEAERRAELKKQEQFDKQQRQKADERAQRRKERADKQYTWYKPKGEPRASSGKAKRKWQPTDGPRPHTHKSTNAWKEHEEQWREFFADLKDSAKQIDSKDVPWPRLRTVLQHMQESELEELPQLYRKLAMSYHPDKLAQRLSKHMTEIEQTRATRHACELFQQLVGHYELLTQ